MKLPNAQRAIISANKLCDYLLNVEHEHGGSKAALLIAMGYSPDDWQRLEIDIRNQHLTADAVDEGDSGYGRSYVIVAPLRGPAGRMVMFRSVW